MLEAEKSETGALIVPPSWAKAVILAELEEDQSDMMSDYFGSRTVRSVALRWSRHTRDLFPELRKAAGTFEPTRFLEHDRYTPRVVLASDVPNANGTAYWKGSYSHWHSELERDENRALRTFPSEAEAREWAERQGPPDSISFDGLSAHFEWTILHDSVEHREKWSMGHGYYLAVSKYSGWQVRKVGLWYVSGGNVRGVEPGPELSR